jgi:AraC-like DNA-binding protein
LYEADNLVAAVPAQEPDTHPLPVYFALLKEPVQKITYTMTSFHSYYGSVKLEGNKMLIIGPVNDFSYTEDSLTAIQKEFEVKDMNHDGFTDFFKNIAPQNWDSFVNTLLFVDFILNRTERSKQDIFLSTDETARNTVMEDYVAVISEEKEVNALYNSFNIEEAMVHFVETGQAEKLKAFAEQARYAAIGKIAPTALRQWKNLFIVNVTLISRAAMRGGLSPSLSYQLSNVYLQQAERLTDVEAVKSLLWQVQFDYANRVASSAIPSSADKTLHEIVQYVRNNTNAPLTVTETAERVGYTRSSLSRKVKKELGFNLSTFIRETKLEDAKDLLAYSDKSITQISNYLCFSSQSHFQKAFKAYVGLTPEKYRKSFWKLEKAEPDTDRH